MINLSVPGLLLQATPCSFLVFPDNLSILLHTLHKKKTTHTHAKQSLKKRLLILCAPVWQVTFGAVQEMYMPFVSLAGSDHVTWPAGQRAGEKDTNLAQRSIRPREDLIIDRCQSITLCLWSLLMCLFFFFCFWNQGAGWLQESWK